MNHSADYAFTSMLVSALILPVELVSTPSNLRSRESVALLPNSPWLCSPWTEAAVWKERNYFNVQQARFCERKRVQQFLDLLRTCRLPDKACARTVSAMPDLPQSSLRIKLARPFPLSGGPWCARFVCNAWSSLRNRQELHVNPNEVYPGSALGVLPMLHSAGYRTRFICCTRNPLSAQPGWSWNQIVQ